MTDDPCAILARTRLGEIKRCLPGCTHLTFAGVTLHFDTYEEFLHFGEVVEDRQEEVAGSSSIEVCYRWISLNMCANSYGSLVKLVRIAIDEAAWRDGSYSASGLSLPELPQR